MRFGLIGAGGIGKIRADALANSPVCELVAVSDLDEARARLDVKFRRAMLGEAMQVLLDGELVQGRTSTP